MGIPQGLEWFDPDDKNPEESRRLLIFSTEERFAVGWFEDDLFFYENNPTEYIQNPNVDFWSYLPKPRSFTMLQEAQSIEEVTNER